MQKILCGVVVLAGLSTVRAANTYNFVTDQSAYDLSQGPVSVMVYLEEKGSSSTLATDGGLDGGAFRVTRSIGETGVKISDLVFNPLFDAGVPFNSKSVTGSLASLTESIGFLSAGVGFDAGHPTWTYLGSITMAADTGGQTTTFTIGGYGNTGNFVTHNLTTLDDPTIPKSVSFTVAVPEPASFSLLTLGGLGLLARRRK